MNLPEPRSRTGCSTCPTSRCCVAFDPELTGFDLLRLTSLGLSVDDIAELRPTRADQAGPDAIFLGDLCAWDLRLRRTGAATVAPPVFVTVSDPMLDPRRCGFLVTLGGRSRCGVYASRPMVCRLFPSAMTPLGVFVDTPETICPPGAFAQERSDLATLTILHRLAALERDAFRVFLVAWNALASSDTRHFYAALLTYSQRLADSGLTDPNTWHSTRDLALSSR